MTPYDQDDAVSPPEVLMSLPRLVRHPSARHIVPPLTRRMWVRTWIARRVMDLAKVIGPFDGPCECDGEHPHKDWPR